MPYDYQPFPYHAPPGLKEQEPRHKAVIVGAGPIGLAMALELANQDIPTVVVDDNNVVSVGSRAICWSKRSLEILDRLGVGDRAVEKGVTWKVGHTYFHEREVYSFDLLPEEGHKMPAFINLQQYYIEQYLVEAAQENPLVDLRFLNKVTAIDPKEDHVRLSLETPDGTYALEADYLLACDGARSPVRDMMGLSFEGELFEDRFLIADIEMEADFPADRRFWFEPPFHPGHSVLLHKQPDNIYRIDFNLGWDADPEHEKKPEVVIPRVEKVVGHANFKLDWVSVYTFQCRRLERFVHGHVIFVGDSAHVVSPFGARGGNGGLQDVDALGWRLAAVLEGRADESLLDAYDRERVHATEENIRHSTWSTRFITPADGAERLFRDQVLALAEKAPFARSWVNSGRLSKPAVYPLKAAPDDPALPDVSRPGAVAPDAPQGNGWLLSALGERMVVLAVGTEAPEVTGADTLVPEMTEEVRARYLGDAGQAIYLIRPDQVVAARWTEADAATVADAIEDVWRGA